MDGIAKPEVKVQQPFDYIKSQAHVKSLDEYKSLYDQSLYDPENFWGDLAKEFHWNKPWSSPFTKSNFNSDNGAISTEWFIGAETNVCYNALDRHIEAGRGNQVAFFWEGNDVGHEKVVTYKQLLDQVCQVSL